MKILVTGAAGFIGSHLCEALLGAEHKVTGMDNFDPFYDRATKERNLDACRGMEGFNFVELDLKDPAATRALVEQGFDRVVHLAGREGTATSGMEDPYLYMEDNYLATLNLLEAMRRTSVGKLVFASSAGVYGNLGQVPFREDVSPGMALSPGTATKMACELMCQAFHNIYSVEVYVLRLFTVYGPRQRPDMAVSRFVGAINRRSSIKRYGDGSSERDYVYIGDVVEGLVKAVERVKGYECINLGRGDTTSLSSLIGLIEELLGQQAMVEESPIPPWSAFRTFADISKAERLLGFAPKVGIKEGLRSFIQWYRKEQKA